MTAARSKIRNPESKIARASIASGVASVEELRRSPGYPSPARRKAGSVAVIECVEDIPCNPCEAACPHGAIRVGTPITRLPVLTEKKCTGCGRCIPACPGLAIFVVDAAHSESEAAISMPYEFLPLPKKETRVDVLDRAGRRVCSGRVVRVSCLPRNRGTAVVTIVVPRAYAEAVRGFRLPTHRERK